MRRWSNRRPTAGCGTRESGISPLTDDPAWLPTEAPSLAAFLAPALDLVPVLSLLALAGAALYVLGVIRLRRAGRRWPAWRTACFLAGSGVIVVVMGSGLERYGYSMFSVFMFQQLTLMMVVPPLLVLGSPGTLLLRATPHGRVGSMVLRWALAGLRSRWGRLIIHPGFMIPLFLMSFYGIYLSGIADAMVASPVGHTSLEVLFLAAGILFTVPVLSNDPLPRRQSHIGKLADVFIEIPLHAFFGVIVMTASVSLVATFADRTAALGLDPIGDQLIAGGLAWSYGEAPGLIILLVLMGRWYRDDTARAARADRQSDLYGDADLDAYNAYLTSLRGQERPRE